MSSRTVRLPISSREKDDYVALLELVANYQRYHCPIKCSNAIVMIDDRRENANLEVSDLVPLIGTELKVSALLSGRRTLTVPVVRAMNKHLGVILKAPVSDERIGVPVTAQIWVDLLLKHSKDQLTRI